MGESWSKPVDILPNLVNFMTPSKTKSGRLILPGHITFGYTDDPAGLTGWKRSSLSGVSDSFEDTVSGWWSGRENRPNRDEPYLFNEGSFFQTDDGIIHMMLRTQMPILCITESADDGETWCEPKLTDFTDNVARVHFGRLTDGRFFCMSTPDPRQYKSYDRIPAILALSKDGVRFDRHFVIGSELCKPQRIFGMYKVGRYGYPFFHQIGNWGFMAYLVNKEDIFIARFSMDELV